MRTLYTRISATTILILFISALAAFLITNVYYDQTLKPLNDEKITNIATQVAHILEERNTEEISDYLTAMADLGYKFYMIDGDGNQENFGDPFSSMEMDEKSIQGVLNGTVYHGIKQFSWRPFVTGFFNNSLQNTVGVPIEVEGQTFALFVRPDAAKLYGEMRIVLAILLGLTLLLSFLFVLVSTRFIVQPIRRLRDATKKIAGGNYHIKLLSNRRDEIGRLASDFQKMSTSLQQIEEKRQEFVSNVSHEIQSPLTSIQGFSQALREEQLTEDERNHYLSIIEQESRRLSGLSDQLLTLSFLDRKQVTEDMVMFNLTDQLRDIISTTEWQWREKDLSIELNLSPVHIKGDPKLLHQVWMNIVTNAIRYTPAEGKITIQVNDGHDNVEVLVSDTGIGIAKEHKAQLFERFFIVDKARTRTQSSTGLGLSIAQKIVEMHYGTIMVESELGEGTTFIVTLPR